MASPKAKVMGSLPSKEGNSEMRRNQALPIPAQRLPLLHNSLDFTNRYIR
jgi:hypothetical protein